MLDRIIHFSVHNKLIVGLLTSALVAWGGYSVTQLPIDAVPDITNNQVQVITQSPSFATQEVERLITFPVEQAMATIPDLEEIRSFSRFGLSVVTLVFRDQTDLYWARQQVSERLKEAQAQIPAGVGSPALAPVTTGLGEIYQYVLHAKPGYTKQYPASELRTIQDWIVRRQLLGTPGVAEVSSFGGRVKQYEVAVDPDRLRSANVGIGEIVTALQKNNQNTGGAYIDQKPNAYFIRSEGLAGSLEDISKIVVRTSGAGVPVLVGDVAKVQFGSAARYGAMTRNTDGEVVGAVVMMLKGANSSRVIRAVKERIATIEKTLPEGVVIEPFLDRTKLVNNAIGTVGRNLAEGALIVVFALVLMLGNLRAGLIVASVIPLAMLFAIAMMNLFGVSGNLMSLGAIDFGLIVDGAVIIVEATLHHLGSKQFPRPLTAPEMDREVYESAAKIRNSAAFGEIIILIVYLPILALVGVEGKMFRPMAQTVSFAILGAFLLSLTYVPAVSALFLSRQPGSRRNVSDRLMDFFHRLYQPLLGFALRRSALVLVTAAALFVASLVVFLNLGGEFIPTLDEGDFAVETRVLAGSSLSQTIEAATRASGILLKAFPDEVRQVVAKIGSSEVPTDPMPVEAGDLMIILHPKDAWTKTRDREELVGQMSEALAVIPGVTFGFQQPIQMRFNELMSGARQDVVIKVYGEDLAALTEQAAKIGKLVNTVRGARDLYLETVTGLPQIVVRFDRDKIAQFGLNIEDVNRVLQTGFAGQSAGLIYEGERRFELVVRLAEANRRDLADVRGLFVTSPAGDQIPLEQLARVDFQTGPSQIQRDNAKRRITVGFNVRNRDVESTVEEIRGKIDAQIKLPAGYYVSYGGQFENLVQAKQRLGVAVPVALLLIFTLLYFTFRSVAQGLLIFTAIPLSAIGGVLALWLRGMPFSISAGVGFVALFGVAVLNGIVLIAYFNQLKAEGMAVRERVLTGTRVRLRPVIMTALVASLGFLPMALSNTAGAEVQKPLATVVIGGLISATLLTLVVLPVLYIRLEEFVSGSRPRVKPLAAPPPGATGANPAGPNRVPCLGWLVGWGFLAASGAFAQPVAPRTYSAAGAVERALAENGGIRAANYGVEAARRLRGAALDLGKTNFGLTHGQTNSANRDNNFSVSQSFAFPSLYAHQSRLSKAQVRATQLNLTLRQRELARDVKSTYYELVYLRSRLRLLTEQDSLYAGFLRAAQVRRRTGETNLLEETTARTQQLAAQNTIAQTEADRTISLVQLQALLNATEAVDVADSVLVRLPDPRPDSVALAGSPQLALARQQVEERALETRVTRARLWPDFTVGYFNQSLIGSEVIDGAGRQYTRRDRFTGIQAGVAIPLWFGAYTARIGAAKINQQVAESNYVYQQTLLAAQLATASQQVRKYQSSLAYYEQSALPQADLIIRQAGGAYRAGEIGYLEYGQSLERALGIRANYLDTLHQYNQSVISLEFILGGNGYQ